MFELVLEKKPKKPVIIEGFPGLGLIGPITTEFLVKHLNAKSIGYIWSEDLLPIATIHEAKVIQPIEIFYDEKNNIVIVHVLTDVKGLEWELSEVLEKLYKELNAKELISIEGIFSREISGEYKTYYYTNNLRKKKIFEKMNIESLREGIIMGVTAAMILKKRNIIASGIFVESHTKLPDSRAAAKIVQVLNEYLGLNVDYKPLIKTAEAFERKLKSLLEQIKSAKKYKLEEHPSYFG